MEKITNFEWVMNDLFNRLREQREERFAQCKDLYTKIEALHKELRIKEEPFDDRISKIENEIKRNAIQEKSSYECNIGSVVFKKGYDRVTYPTAEIEHEMHADSYIRDRIAPMRRVIHVNPVAIISIK